MSIDENLDPLDDDRNQNNPCEDVDWGEVYGNMYDFDDFLDHDHSMDY
jgi:hypothetical protein